MFDGKLLVVRGQRQQLRLKSSKAETTSDCDKLAASAVLFASMPFCKLSFSAADLVGNNVEQMDEFIVSDEVGLFSGVDCNTKWRGRGCSCIGAP